MPRASSTLLLSAPLTKDGLSFIAELQEVDGLDAATERARSQSAPGCCKPELTLRGDARPQR